MHPDDPRPESEIPRKSEEVADQGATGTRSGDPEEAARVPAELEAPLADAPARGSAQARRPRRHPFFGTLLLMPVLLIGAIVGSSVLDLVLIAGDQLLTEGMMRQVRGARRELGGFDMYSIIIIVPLFGIYACRLSLRAQGFRRERALLQTALGLVFGAALIALPACLGRLAGFYSPVTEPGTIDGAATGAAALGRLPLLLLTFAIAAFAEEVLMRGLLIPYWRKATGYWGSLLITSGLFTLAHGGNANVSWLGLLGIFFAGLLLGLAFLETRSLWFPTALHFTWNVTMAAILGLPVSGQLTHSLLRWQAVPGDVVDFWLGGEFGPEEGASYHLTVAVGVIMVYRLARRIASPPLELAGSTPEPTETRHEIEPGADADIDSGHDGAVE